MLLIKSIGYRLVTFLYGPIKPVAYCCRDIDSTPYGVRLAAIISAGSAGGAAHEAGKKRQVPVNTIAPTIAIKREQVSARGRRLPLMVNAGKQTLDICQPHQRQLAITRSIRWLPTNTSQFFVCKYGHSKGSY
jgi:hypothetical protein